MPFDRERVDEICEKGVLWTILAILVYGPLAIGAAGTYQFLTILGLGVVVGIFWTVRIWVRKQYRFLLAPFCWVVLAFTGYTIFLYSRADIEYYARQELLQVLFYTFLFFAILDNLTRQESIQLLLFTLIGVGILESFYAVYQFFTGSKHILWYGKPAIYLGRASGTYICPNHLAGFLEMLLPMALAFTVTGRLKHLSKVFLGYAAFAMIAGVGVTLSRGGYVAAGISLGLFFIMLLWKRDFRIPALSILIVLISAGSFFGYRSYYAQLRLKEVKVDQGVTRQLYWRPAIEMWKENPWFGVGPNHYDWRFRKWRTYQSQIRPVYAHNDYLNTLADYGLIGAAIVGLGLGVMGWGVMKTWKYVRRGNEIGAKGSNRSSIVFGISIGMVAILAHSVVDFNMHVPANAMTAVALMAILTSHLRFATERYWFNPGIIGRLAGTVFIGVGLGYFILQVWRVGMETHYNKKAEKPLRFSERLEVLKKAHAIQPTDPDVAREIGEVLRKRAWEGNDGYQELLREALGWYQKAMKLNRWDPYNYAYSGMCYAWLGDKKKSAEMFEKAKSLDPESYYLLALYGWHLLQEGDLIQAKKYFLKSYGYNGWANGQNEMAKNYLDLIDRRLAEEQQQAVELRK